MTILRALLVLVALIGVGYAIVCALMYALQDRLVFAPTLPHEGSPRDAGLSFNSVTVRNPDGVDLDAWHIPHPDPLHTVLFFHGNAGNMSGRIETARRMHEMGFEVVMFDYRGYGRSSGVPSEAGLFLDARAMWQFVVDELGRPPQSILLVGRSLGGAVAIELATEVTARALIVESSFTSVADMGKVAYPWLPVRLLTRIPFDSESRVQHVLCPILVVHGTDDPLTPLAQGKRLFERATQPKAFQEIPGVHNAAVTVDLEFYRDTWLQFLSAHEFPYN